MVYQKCTSHHICTSPKMHRSINASHQRSSSPKMKRTRDAACMYVQRYHRFTIPRIHHTKDSPYQRRKVSKGLPERSKLSSWVSPSRRPWEREARRQSARERETRDAMPPIAWIVAASISERGLEDKSKFCNPPSWPKISAGSE